MRYYYSEIEIDFTNDYISYNQFLLQEFFNTDDATWRKLASHYHDLHGSRSLGYLSRKFHEWKEGNYHLTDLMTSRILSITPDFLTDTAKEKLRLNDFMMSIKNTITSNDTQRSNRLNSLGKIRDLNDFNGFFNDEKHRTANLMPMAGRFYVMRKEDTAVVTNVVRHIANVKLENLYRALKADLDLITTTVRKEPFLNFEVIYRMKLSSKFTHIEEFRNNFPVIQFDEDDTYTSNSKYKAIANKYLAYELIKASNSKGQNNVSLSIASTDLEIFSQQYYSLVGGDSEADMDGIFNGQAGTLSVKTKVIPTKLLKTYIAKSFSKIVVTCALSVLIFAWFNNGNLLDGLKYNWFFVLIVSPFLLGYLWGEVQTIIDLKSKYNNS